MAGNDKVVLMVLDGWGARAEKEGNAITAAVAPNYRRLLGSFPSTQLEASGLPVGLPDGVMGNSEVGHMNIGSGRCVQQEQVRIHTAITDGSFYRNEVLRNAMAVAREKGTNLHLIGLVSQGNVHSAERHYLALIGMARKEKVPAERVFVHAFLDGRDTAPRSAEEYLKNVETTLAREGGRIASISGRFYAMDRDKRWERVDQAYRALVRGDGFKTTGALEALHAAYVRAEDDEFVQPTLVTDPAGTPIAKISSGDSVICFNFRPDRMREIVRALTNHDGPVPSLDRNLKIEICSFTKYEKSFTLPVAFAPQDLTMCLGEVVSCHHMQQFRTAETEKYAHVTYFLNGGRETPFDGEERQMIPSPKVRTYDLQPEMSSLEVTESVLHRIRAGNDRLIVVNFAQPDMVGHTGIFDAAVAAVEATDRAIGKIAEAAAACGYTLFITADHGNVEQMKDPVSGKPFTAHTTNPVPFICIGPEKKKVRLADHGALCDIAPTVLKVLGITPPAQMTGKNLLIV
ncbi:MAG: 2,3-bisphosphoglycerate-independent phosphoglycerate mutase [Pseudomonadota bacterium]